MQTSTTSKQYTINISDIWKGLIVAVLAPVLAIIINSIDMGELTFNWSLILKTALAAGLGYLLKNFLTPSAITVKGATAETVQKVKDGAAEVVVDNKIAPPK